MPTIERLSTVSLLVVGLTAASAAAQNVLDTVGLHGYGGWVYGETDGNVYLNGTEAGSYDNVSFALNVSANPADRLMIFAQVQFHLIQDVGETELDFAFGEWRFSDALRLRIGQVKQPFGIYTEVFDVGTVRPFFDLPQGLYGPQGIVAEAYLGAGVVGQTYGNGRWGLQYDVYVGKLKAEAFHPAIAGLAVAVGVDLDEAAYAFDTRDLVGGRLIVTTPITGLTFGASAYTGDPDTTDTEGAGVPGLELMPDVNHTRTTWGLQFEYLGDALWARAEYAVLAVEGVEFAGSYAEIAYKLDEHWQLAGRYDRADISGTAGDAITTMAEMFDHQDIAAAVNYWFAPEMVVRLEYHQVEGTRFAAPPAEDYVMDLFTGDFRTETELIQVGVQFSF